MKKIILAIIILNYLVITVCFASSSKEANWEYVLSKGNFNYSVDMNSIVSSAGPTLIFWLAAQDNDKDRLTLVHVAVKLETREYRSEEMYIYDLKSKELLHSVKIPSEWKAIGNDSTIDITLKYISDHRKYHN